MAKNEYQIVSQPGHTVDYRKDSLIQLIREGYGAYSKDTEQPILTQVQSYEYRKADKVYFTLNKEGFEMGSLSVSLRPNAENDPFWKSLQTLLPREPEVAFLACEIYGIVVHPQVRREGIATLLLVRMIEDLSPQIIFGQTNVPQVVLLRAKTTKQYDYRTFYGFCEVTPFLDYKRESDGRPFIEASFIAQEAESNEEGVYRISTHVLPPNISIIENFPLEIQRAFEPVQKAQKAIGRKQTAVTTLVSIRDRFFSNE